MRVVAEIRQTPSLTRSGTLRLNSLQHIEKEKEKEKQPIQSGNYGLLFQISLRIFPAWEGEGTNKPVASIEIYGKSSVSISSINPA